MPRTTHHSTAARFVAAVKSLAASEVGGRAKLIFAALVVLLVGANLLNVINSYVGRNFFSAIQERNKAEYLRQAIFYVGVFAASTFVATIARFAEERLGLLWRDFVTRRSVKRYLAGAAYYRMEAAGALANPDQRIAEDARAFTVTTLSFVLMLLNSGFTIIAFSGVLWSISPKLFVVAVLYAALGSFITILLARPLVKLNSDQLDKEASFRSELLHVRQKSESILVAARERQLGARLVNRLDALVANFRQIIAVNRNVGFVSTGYNWLIQLIPVLIIAPLFMKGDIEFGVISQSAVAFTALVAAFSLIVREFQSISNFAAVVFRLEVLLDAIDQSQAPVGSGIRIVEAEGHLAYGRLTILSARDGAPMLRELSVSIPAGTRVLVTGSNPAATRTLFRATAGLAIPGSGQILRPGAKDLLFLPHRPYLPPGSLREILEDAEDRRADADERIKALLQELGLEEVWIQAGGLDQEHDWSDRVSSKEQQLLALARILLAAPQFAFLDRIGETLGSEQAGEILRLLSQRSITYLNCGEPDDRRDLYDAVLECNEDGRWIWKNS
jgi:putative ATP-binding cassette transporter